ncbi:MAG: DUF3793 family protein [Clostridiales bacterium]|jgi:hypothetical protein|nr:DUF3793 family protein [Clostridiales bacterium]
MSETELTVGRHCAAALAGIKPACIVNCAVRGEKRIAEIADGFAKKGADVSFEVLKKYKSRFLLMVYRKSVLEKHLLKSENGGFLRTFGYPERVSADAYVGALKEKFKGGDFPHEIGIFLGYPREDVEGFIADPSAYEVCGPWKVYAGAEEKKRVFERYKRCSENICGRLLNGCGLNGIFSK